MADSINILSLCSGVGMLDIGVEVGLRYLGFTPGVLGYCERDAYAAACLLARMAEASLGTAPVWCGDMRDLDARPMRGIVDLITAGLPCQPYSCAGKQEGNTDRRSWGDGDGPIVHFLRIVAECSPAVVFLENVPAWVRGGWFRPVGEELCRMGFTLESPLFLAAEDVGASHRRERVFILAHSNGAGLRGFGERQRQSRDAEQSRQPLAVSAGGGQRELRQSSECDGLADGRNEPLDNADGGRAFQSGESVLGQPIQQSGRASESSGRCAIVDDTTGSRPIRSGQRGIESKTQEDGKQTGMPGLIVGRDELGHASGDRLSAGDNSANCISDRTSESNSASRSGDVADARSKGREESRHSSSSSSADGSGTLTTAGGDGCPLFAPGPGDLDGWNRVVADGSIDFRAPAVKSGVRVLADGMSLVVDASRADQLRCGGNGCVPLQAAVALVHLLSQVISPG